MSEEVIFSLFMTLFCVFMLGCGAIDLAAVARKNSVIKPVEFYPPKGFSPLDVALVYSARGAKLHTMLNPLLLYWASKGYVKIEDDGRGLKVTKLKWLPTFEESGSTNQKTYDCELTLFREMFVGHDTFYTLAAGKSINNSYEEALDECKKMSRSVIGKKGKRISLAMKACCVLLIIIFGAVISLYLKQPIAFVLLFPVIGTFLIKFMPAPAVIRVPFMAVWGGVPLVAVLFMFPMPLTFKIALGTAMIMLVVTVGFLAEKADFRSKEDLKAYGKVCSFKRFLIVADKKRLEMLVEENPDYFYDVLPFFYVFGISKKMKGKFDRIIPDGSLRALGAIRDIYID